MVIKKCQILYYNMIDIVPLTPFMFTANNVQYKDAEQSTIGNDNQKRRVVRRVSTLYMPKQRDPLFWCFYIGLEGMEKYEQIKSHCFVTEKEVKISAVEKLRERADELKANKLKRNEVEDALVNRPKLTLSAFQALCFLYNVSFVYTNDSIYYEYAYGGESMNVVVLDKGRPSLYTGNDPEQYVENIRKGRWHIEDSAKPIRAISAYKLSDLRDFCDRLNLEHDGKKKAELYQLICEKIL